MVDQQNFGFFDIQPATRDGRKPKAKASAPERLDCQACGLYKGPIRSPQIDPYGDNRLGIMTIGEGLGEIEDQRGKPWQGPVGMILQASARKAGIDLFRDCINLNSVNCRPTEPAKTRDVKNRAPTSFEIACCRQVKVLPAIEKFKPKVIITAGYPALQSVVGYRFGFENLDPVSKWTGAAIPDRLYKAWVCPVFHPSYIARSKDQVVRTIWERDLRNAFAMAKEEVPEFEDEENFVDIIENEEDVEQVLSNLLDSPEIVLDIETTGLKPYNKSQHEIISWAISSMKHKRVYSFLHPKSDRALLLIKKLLRSTSIGKIAWNMKFEHVWIKTILGYEVQNWTCDPMQAVHLEDNRTGLCGLDIQAYMKLGRTPWDTEVREYMKSDKKNKNSVNRLREYIAQGRESVRKLLLYNGLDVKLTKMLVKEQRQRKPSSLYELIHDGTLAFADAEMAGIRVKRKKAQRQYDLLTQEIEQLNEKAKKGEVFEALQKRYGEKANLNSGPQLSQVLFKDLSYKPLRLTEKKQIGATDDESLERLGLPDLSSYLEAKKLSKIQSTYLEGWLRECGDDGFVHPFFSLHTTRSGRSSGDSPNPQNVPIRDERAQKLCRGVLYPRKGHQWLEGDFSGIEVRTAAAITRDPNLIKYVTDPSTDMHRDMAIEIFKWQGEFDHKKVKALKDLRFAAKNGFVFASFYGSYFEQTADGLANLVGLPTDGKWKPQQGMKLSEYYTIGDHLIEQGIKSYKDFEKHIEDVEHNFWYKRFRVYTEWKKKWWKEYQSRGYLETPTGFPSVDVLGRNESYNRPVQGGAAHCLFWIYVKLWKECKKKKWDSRLAGQVHDSFLIDTNPNELEEIVEVTEYYREELPKEFKWIGEIPMLIEFEVCDIDRPWSEKHPYEDRKVI